LSFSAELGALEAGELAERGTAEDGVPAERGAVEAGELAGPAGPGNRLTVHPLAPPDPATRAER
jgi:hypothetical protein